MIFKFRVSLYAWVGALLLIARGVSAATPQSDVDKKLQGFDAYMEKTLKDWNAPGAAVGIVVDGQLVFAKGYGYRDYGKKLPFTTHTVIQIASNTKLFTAVAAGLLVEEGKLTWDAPVRESVPTIRFYDDQLNNQVTLRDMLSHRTGITRHDTIWDDADLSRKELFERLAYLEPAAPLRTTFLYNNLMYAAAGYLIELQTGKTWEQWVKEKILQPLQMNSTYFSVADMLKQPEFGVPYTERRDSFELHKIPYYEDMAGVGPCGAIVSNIEDVSHWLVALMNDGKYRGVQVLSAATLKATLKPSIAINNTDLQMRGWTEILNVAYGMGRWTASYRGHLLAYHGGALGGFHTQISMMPQDHIGVIVFEIGNHSAPLRDIVSYNVYERLLGMTQTPWSKRQLEIRLKNKRADTERREKASAGKVANARPSHALSDYVGEYDHPAYGAINITLAEGQLHFRFHKTSLLLAPFQYDRFDTPDDEEKGKWSVNFRTSPQGDIDAAVMSLDEGTSVFVRRPDPIDPKLVTQVAGSYRMPDGATFQIAVQPDGTLSQVSPGGPVSGVLHRVKGLTFKAADFSDVTYEFIVRGGRVIEMRKQSPSGEIAYPAIP